MDPGLYEKPEIQGVEADGRTFKALWMDIDEFRSDRAKLYPKGLLELLGRMKSSQFDPMGDPTASPRSNRPGTDRRS